MLQTKCNSATIGIDGQNAALEFLALFENFVRVTDLASPRHIGDVQQTIDALFEFDKRTVVGQVADTTVDLFVDRILFLNLVPWVVLSLLHTQRHLFAVFVDAQNGNIDLVADVDQLVRVVNTLDP